MAETAAGFVYPDSTGSTRLWEHFQALAESVEAWVAPLTATPADAAWPRIGYIGKDTETVQTDASGYRIIEHGFGFTPSLVIATPIAYLGGGYAQVLIGTDQYTATTFRVRYSGVSSATDSFLGWVGYR